MTISAGPNHRYRLEIIELGTLNMLDQQGYSWNDILQVKVGNLQPQFQHFYWRRLIDVWAESMHPSYKELSLQDMAKAGSLGLWRYDLII